MAQARLSIRTPSDFNFWKTVFSHGWCSLEPFAVDKDRHTLRTILALTDKTVWTCVISHRKSSLDIQASSKATLSPSRRAEICKLLGHCFRLDEDLREFYRQVRKYPEYRWIARVNAGRMMRAPTAFEDIVKMICTTNCNWALTTIMVENLCGEFGAQAPGGFRTFPTAESIAGTSEKILRQKVRAGYRAPYILEFATRVAKKELDPESFRSSPLSTPDLLHAVKGIKGIGPYAAENLLRLFGRYDFLGLDSWVRAKYSELHRGGRTVNDRTIRRRYEKFGKWSGLFFWLEMTRAWYDHKFPF